MVTGAGEAGFKAAGRRLALVISRAAQIIGVLLLALTASYAQTAPGAPPPFRGMRDCVQNGGVFECVPYQLGSWKFVYGQNGEYFNTLDEYKAWALDYINKQMPSGCKMIIREPVVLTQYNESVEGGYLIFDPSPSNVPTYCPPSLGPNFWYMSASRFPVCPAATPPYSFFAPSAVCERWAKAQPACPAHASGTPCACDAGYVFNSAKTACVTLQLSVTPSVTYIPIESRVLNKHVLTQSDLALNLQKGNEPASGITITLQASRTAGAGAGHDTINGPANPTDAKGNAAAVISTRDQPGTAVVMASDTFNIKTISPGVVKWFPADYQSGFIVSCYTLSQESEFSAKRTTNNACGLKGKTYRTHFLDDVSVQGSGIGLDGKFIRYDGKRQGMNCFKFDTCPHTASGKCAVVGTTIAVDPKIIPLGNSQNLGSHVNIQILGSRYAQDTGSKKRIKDYRIDNYVGIMPRATCYNFGMQASSVTFLNY